MSDWDSVIELAKSAGKLQAELNEMGVGTRESHLEANNASLREENDLLTAELDECWQAWEDFSEELNRIPREPEEVW